MRQISEFSAWYLCRSARWNGLREWLTDTTDFPYNRNQSIYRVSFLVGFVEFLPNRFILAFFWRDFSFCRSLSQWIAYFDFHIKANSSDAMRLCALVFRQSTEFISNEITTPRYEVVHQADWETERGENPLVIFVRHTKQLNISSTRNHCFRIASKAVFVFGLFAFQLFVSIYF